MTCDRNCNKSRCAGRACGTTVVTTRNHAVILRDIHRAMQAGEIRQSTITALQSLCGALPQRIGPQRLLIEALIARGELGRAEKYLGPALLARPTHRRLVLLRCRCLIYMCDFQTAIAELHQWMPHRPWDVEAHELAGEAATLAGQDDLAAGHFAMACAYSFCRVARRSHLARAHIEAGKFEEARQWIIDAGQSSPRLEGRWALRRGELLNASEFLYDAVMKAPNSFQRQLALVELLSVRRRLGYQRAVQQAIALVQPHETLALAHASETLISQGAPRQATSFALRILRRARRHQCAGPVAVVASAMAQRRQSAARLLARRRSQNIAMDPIYTSRLWRESLFHKIVAQQAAPRTPQTESQSLLLQPVLKRTLRVLDERLRDASAIGMAGDIAALQQQRAECLIALGRTTEALMAVRAAA